MFYSQYNTKCGLYMKLEMCQDINTLYTYAYFQGSNSFS